MTSNPRTATRQEYGLRQFIFVGIPSLTWEMGAASQLEGHHHNQGEGSLHTYRYTCVLSCFCAPARAKRGTRPKCLLMGKELAKCTTSSETIQRRQEGSSDPCRDMQDWRCGAQRNKRVPKGLHGHTVSKRAKSMGGE